MKLLLLAIFLLTAVTSVSAAYACPNGYTQCYPGVCCPPK